MSSILQQSFTIQERDWSQRERERERETERGREILGNDPTAHIQPVPLTMTLFLPMYTYAPTLDALMIDCSPMMTLSPICRG